MSENIMRVDELFQLFLNSACSIQIYEYFTQLCNRLDINLNAYYDHVPLQCYLYELIRQKLKYWKADEIWSIFQKKCDQKDHQLESDKAMRVLVIGCGPVGLRLGIELALMGIKCHIVEKRDRFSRNNILHLWPFTIVDLNSLGAKKFYGKFCIGSIDHISIKNLQCMLYKIALLLGVEVHFNTSFEQVIEPSILHAWKGNFEPKNHKLNNLNFDVIIGADGRRNTLSGFERKELRTKLAIGVTANFLNKDSQEERQLKEVSGLSYIYDQKFFKDLKQEINVDMENIVYYKEDTHYFVMTPKKQSLLDEGVLLRDYTESTQLLDKSNINSRRLFKFAQKVACFATGKQYKFEFALNHYGEPDVAMFDFTLLYQALNSSRITVRKGHVLLSALAGDSLIEPFWPNGNGIARGFLAAFDVAWMIKGFAQNKNHLELLHERETIFQLLSQASIDNLSKKLEDYSLDPATRYINLNLNRDNYSQFKHLYDTDSPLSFMELRRLTEDRKRKSLNNDDGLLNDKPSKTPKLDLDESFASEIEDERKICCEYQSRTPIKQKSVRNLVSLFRSKSEYNPTRVRKLQQQNLRINQMDLNEEDTLCYVCGEKVYLVERVNIMGAYVHANCFRCTDCAGSLRSALYFYKKDPKTSKNIFYCNSHFKSIKIR